MADDRKAALDAALKKIEKNYGKGAIMKLGEKVDQQISTIPSGSLALDVALGVGGYPRGRIVEVYGPESSGKTTVALHAIAEVQKNGGTAAFIDAEHALDPQYAQKLGVNIDDLLLSQPDTGEQGLEIADALVSSGAVDIVVIDSVAALVPRAEIDGEMGDTHVGLQARLMSQALRKLSGSINKTKTIAIFINQIREKVGIMFGNPETTPGGRALKFYSTIRLEVRRAEQLKSGTDIIGNRTKIKVVKNKVAPPFKVAEVDMMYGQGISQEGELLDMAVEQDIVDKSGAWYAYKGDRIGQGRENAKNYMREHQEMMLEVSARVRDAYGIGTGETVTLEEAQEELHPNERGFSMTRATYAGGQRYSSVWTGDNMSLWSQMRMSISMNANLGISGFSFVGNDVSGFGLDSSEELFIRWMEMGPFIPIFRNHSNMYTRRQEPWAFGPRAEKIAKKSIELRYELLPYIYDLYYISHKEGLPIFRPMIMEYEKDMNLLNMREQFMLGENMLVAPVLYEGERSKTVYLPRGIWFNYFTMEKLQGGKWYKLPCELDEILVFVKEGAIIPTYNKKFRNVKERPKNILLKVFGENAKGFHYNDDGHTMEYLEGKYTYMDIKVVDGKEELKLINNGYSIEEIEFEIIK